MWVSERKALLVFRCQHISYVVYTSRHRPPFVHRPLRRHAQYDLYFRILVMARNLFILSILCPSLHEGQPCFCMDSGAYDFLQARKYSH